MATRMLARPIMPTRLCGDARNHHQVQSLAWVQLPFKSRQSSASMTPRGELSDLRRQHPKLSPGLACTLCVFWGASFFLGCPFFAAFFLDTDFMKQTSMAAVQ